MFALGGVSVACGDDDAGITRVERETPRETATTTAPPDATIATTVPASPPPAAPADVDCSAEAIGDGDGASFVVAHAVVEGRLSDACFGAEDDRLLAAWEDLVVTTPPAQLDDLALFAGFADDGAEEQTVAFVNVASDDGSTLQMSVNLDAYADDPAAAQLTLAHEFAHVFTRVTTQIDRTDEGFRSCETYQAADGCFLPGSLIDTWVDTFWTEDMLAALPADDEPSVSDGDELCSVDPSFLDPYAASNPEEDFAESFSAYVFDVPVEAPELRAKLDWLAAQPGLAEFRERADAAGLTPRNNECDGCG